jgi:hypothetical protein
MSLVNVWNRPGMNFLAGLGVGLVLLVGFVLGSGWGTQAAPEVRLNAMSGYGGETFGMITGPVDDQAEGVFLLDYLTGDLQCYVINPRTGKFGAWFKRNVVTDLNVEKGKKPAFIMSTGMVNFPRGGTLKRPANCVVYIADANTGRFAAYTLPWTPGAFAAGAPQADEMILLDGGQARAVEVRE